MELRLAAIDDLQKLKEMYTKIISRMKENGIEIWDDVYPCEFFKDDIGEGNLYLLENENGIAGAFVLCDSNAGEAAVEWERAGSKAVYLDRLGVNAALLNQGIGTALLHCAAECAKRRGAEYLRLFVVDFNMPAISLYQKAGFTQAGGAYIEVIDAALSFREYGFEQKL